MRLFVHLKALLRVPRCSLLSKRCAHQQAEFTSVRYPHIKRGPYGVLEEADFVHFEKLLPGRVVTNADDLDMYNTDWLQMVKGCSRLLLKPKTTEEVSSILQYCNTRSLAVVPQGGNTGLVGGSVPVFDEIILSTQLMDQIIELNPLSGVLVCQSGCILETLDEYVGKADLKMPYEFGSKGSCQIGGNVSTNAGGMRLLRYGGLHGCIVGLEAVRADGQVIDCMSTLRKDNTGYDIKQLFIGSEGTLGVVTKVAILCAQKPQAVNLAFLGCDSFKQVLETLNVAKSQLSEVLSAFEFMDGEAMACVCDNLRSKNPLNHCPFYVVVETSGSNTKHDEEKLSDFLETVMASETVSNGTLAMDGGQMKELWGLRERIAEALLHDGYCYKYDVSLPTEKLYDLVLALRERLGTSVVRVVGYGHVGDGNLHLNITSNKYSTEITSKIEPFIWEWTAQHQGSISAEHGLGLMKRDHIHYSKSPIAVDLMKQMKQLFDPRGILNPYKTIPSL